MCAYSQVIQQNAVDATVVKPHSLLMSDPMVRAYLAGSKGQTRRTYRLDLINTSPDEWTFRGFETGVKKGFAAVFTHPDIAPGGYAIKLPYGGVGDALWFRETWKMWERDEDGKDFLHYRADDAKVDPTWWTDKDWTAPNPKWHRKDGFEKWQSSMLMPMMCSRFVDITILAVRIERLHDITRDDAKAEGVEPVWTWNNDMDPKYFKRSLLNPYVANYSVLWDELNGERLPWDLNPWVWVYEFKKFQEVRK